MSTVEPTERSDSLSGQTALVTGAGAGIGAAIARRLAGSGALVAVVDRNADSAEETAASIAASGGSAVACIADLSRLPECRRVVEEVVRRVGPIDLLVNNAADHGTRHGFLEVDPAEWERVLATNLTAAAFLSQAVAPTMITGGGGAIINITAIQADLPAPTYASYVTSKGGLVALTKALAVELSPHGIRVNAVAPGAISTGSTNEALAATGDPSRRAPTLLGRMGTADEVANVCWFLASPGASFITGAILVVDGGRSLSREPDPFADFAALTGLVDTGSGDPEGSTFGDSGGSTRP